MKLRQLALALAFLTGCPNQKPPPPDASVEDSGAPNPMLIVEPDPSTLTLVEGEPSVTFLVKLSEDPQQAIAAAFAVADPSVLTISPVEGSLDSTNFADGVTVTLLPLDDDDAANDTTDIRVTTDVGSAVYTVTVVDDDAPNLVVAPLQLAVVEGDAGTFGVRFSSPPADTVSVSVRSSDGARATVSPTALSFDGSNWMTIQTVTITSFDDVDLVENMITVDLDNPLGEDATVQVTITDDDGQAFVLTATELTIGEGATATAGVSLAFAPVADITVSVSSSSQDVGVDVTSLTFTPLDYMIPKTITASGLDDPNIATETATITLSSPDVPSDGTVEVTVVDDDTQIIEVTTSSVTVTETGTTTFGVRLGFAPSADLMVTLAVSEPSKIGAAPTTLTFTGADWDQFQDVTVAGVLDLDTDDELEDITLSAPGAGDVDVSVTVRDDDVQAILADSPFITVDEGGMAALGIRLAFQPSADVTVSVASLLGAFTTDMTSLIFTPLDYDVAQIVTLTGVQDQNVGDESDSLELSSLDAGMLSVPVTVVEDDVQAILVSANMITVAENGFVTFDVSLAFQPAANEPVVITPADLFIGANPTALVFTSADWSVPQSVTITALDDANVIDEQSSLSVGSATLGPVTVSVFVTDDDAQAIVLDTNALTVSENGTGAFMVSLGFQPAAPVTISIQSSDGGAAMAAPSVLMFDGTSYATPQPVTVSGVDDADTSNETVTFTVSGTGLMDATVVVSVTDDDLQALVLTRTTLALTEGNNDTVGVSLAFQPAADVTVTIASSDPSVTAAPLVVTFTSGNYQTPQVVTLAAVDDVDTANETAIVTFSSAGVLDATVDVTVTDDDVQSLVVTPLAISVGEAGTDNIFVSLAFQPAGAVTVSIASGDTSLAVPQTATLMFDATTYATPVAVAIAGVQDADVEDEMVTITVSSAGLADRTVDVTVVDDDILNLNVNPTSLALTEGGAAQSFGVQLTQQPAATLAVTIAPSVAGVVTLGTTMITFDTTNWNVVQNVTVSPVDDADALDEDVTLTVSAVGLTPRTVLVSVEDDDAQAIVLSTNTLDLTEGAGGVVTVRLAADPVTPVTVSLVSSDAGAASVSAGTFTFDSTTYAIPQTVDVTAVDDADTRDESAILTFSSAVATDETVTVTVTDDDVQALVLTTNTVAIDEGGTGVVGISLAFDPVTPVTVTAQSSDPAAAGISSTMLTFDSSNYDQPQNLTVTGVQDDDTASETETVTLMSGVTATEIIDVTVTDDDVQALLVSATALTVTEGMNGTFTVRLAFDPVTAATVDVSISDPAVGSALPVSLGFDSTNWSVAQTVTVSAFTDTDTVDDSATITLSSAVAPDEVVLLMVDDDDVQAIIVSTNALAIDENAADSFTVRLAFDPVTPQMVTITNSDAGAVMAAGSVTFDSGNYFVAQTVNVTAVDDDDALDENVTLTLSGAGAPLAEVVTVAVNDDDTQAIVISSTEISVGEGQSTTITVELAFNPITPAVVTVTSNDPGAATALPAMVTFDSTNYDVPQTITIAGVQDADLADEGVVVTFSSAVANDVTADVSVNDDDVQALVLTSNALIVPEGGSRIFRVSLAFQPAANVVVNVASNDTTVATLNRASMTFTPTTYATPQIVRVFGVQDIDLADEATTIDVTSVGIPPAVMGITVEDEDVQAFVLNPAAVNVAEGAVASFDVSLMFQPAGPVNVMITSNDTGAATVPASVMFDATTFATPQSVPVMAEQDDDTRDETPAITLSSVDVPVPGMVAVSVNDDDTQALLVSPVELTVLESGEVDVFSVSFAFEPDGPTIVTITSNDPGAVDVTPAQLTFDPTNYTVPQFVDVAGVSDADVVDELVDVDVATAIAATQTVVVTVNDDDTQAIMTSVNALTVTEDTGPGSFTVRLAFMPQANTTVTITPSNGAASVNPTSVTFTPQNYAVARTVAVVGTTDLDQVDASSTLTLASGGIADATVTVTVIDDDDQRIIVSANSVQVDEESTTTFTVRLAFVPLAPVETITLTSADLLAATVNPVMIAFDATDFATPVTVTAMGVTDEDILDETVNVALSSSGGGTPGVSVTINVNDIDIQDIVLSAAALNLVEGGQPSGVTASFSQDPSGSQDITVTSLDPQAVSAAPGTLTFDSGNYTVGQPVTIGPVDDDDVRDETVTVQLTSPNVTPQAVVVSVADDDTQAILVSLRTVPVTEGASTTFDVSLQFRPTNPVTVTVVSTDPGIASALPAQLTFDANDFATPQPVTVTGTQDGDLDDEGTTVTLSTGVLAPPEGAADVTVPIDVTDDDQQVIVTANVPATLGTSVQEGGPGVAFEVTLGFPPRLSEGGTDTVDISSTLPNLSFNPSTILFDITNFDVPVQVVVTAGDDLDEATDITDVNLEIPEEVSGTHQVQVVDDEVTVITNTTYAGLTGGTLFTKRQNIGWGMTRLGVVGFDASGETRIGSNTRELDDEVVGPTIANGGGGPLSAESVEFDGTSFGFFVTSANGIELARSDETAASTFLLQNVAGAAARNFWPAFDGNDTFGLVFRENGVVSDRLRMRTVETDGTLGTSFTLTIVDGSDDVQPNAHFNGTGYTVLYSSATEVRCLRTNAQGALIAGSDAVLPGFPAGGAFVSSVMAAGSIVAAYDDATNSINVAEIDPAACSVITSAQVGGANVFLSSPPSIAWNGTELAIAYDYLNNSVEEVGVLLVTPGLTYRDNYTVGTGSRPSIIWAGDRWALRHGSPVVVTVGSFQTLCADGLQSPGEDDIDCGGSCPPCIGD